MGEGSVVTHLNGSDITRDSQAKRSGAQGKDFWVSRLLPGRTGWWGRGQGVGRRAQNEKLTPSNPRGWPNRSGAADLEERPQRAVILNSEQGHWFCSNFVRTSKVRGVTRVCMYILLLSLVQRVSLYVQYVQNNGTSSIELLLCWTFILYVELYVFVLIYSRLSTI